MPPAVEVQSLNHWTTKKCQERFLEGESLELEQGQVGGLPEPEEHSSQGGA